MIHNPYAFDNLRSTAPMPTKDSPNKPQNPVQEDTHGTLCQVLKLLEPGFDWFWDQEIQDRDEFPILIFKGHLPVSREKICCTYCVRITGPGHYEMWISH